MATFRPGKPYRLLSLTTPYATSAGTEVVVFDTEDDDGAFGTNTDGGQTEIEIPGLYAVSLTLRRGARATAAVWVATILLNGVGVASCMADSSTAARAACCSTHLQLDQGDILQAECQNGGGANIESASSRFSIVRIGPVRWT